MARPDADALAPFALPLRREADAVIADANGQTVLIVDPSRNLDEDAAERIADLVFSCLSAAAPEVGAVLRHHDGRTGAFVCTEEDGRYRVRSLRGTGFWVFHPDDCDQLISGAAPNDEALPVAWVIRTKDGHVRMWTMSEARARTAAAAWGMEAKQEGLSPIAHPAHDALRVAVEALEKAKDQWDPPLIAPDEVCEAGGAMDPVTGWLSAMMRHAFGIRSAGGRLKRMVNVIVAAEALAALQGAK